MVTNVLLCSTFLPGYWLYLHCMKLLVLIVSLLFSLFSGEREEFVCPTPSSECFADLTQNREICFTSAQGYTFAGNGSTYSVSVRTTQSGRRINQQVRSTFRFVKDGKVVDNNHLYPFLFQSDIHSAGMFISERYLFSICCLRL